jgi:hypothetical protein
MILIGPGRGCKSTIGALLAERLKVPFLDLDRHLAGRIGDISQDIDQHEAGERPRMLDVNASKAMSETPPYIDVIIVCKKLEELREAGALTSDCELSSDIIKRVRGSVAPRRCAVRLVLRALARDANLLTSGSASNCRGGS